MDERIFDFKFTKFNIKRFQNIKWHVHSSKFYEIHQEAVRLYSLIIVIVIYFLFLNYIYLLENIEH